MRKHITSSTLTFNVTSLSTTFFKIPKTGKYRRTCLWLIVYYSTTVCTLPKADGSGWDHLERYYYNKGTGACEQFYYKGQGGNENCFTSQKECDYTTQFCKKYTPPTQGNI